ncbi:hypothetical protein ACFQ87_46635, partial [Kitasatospora sp. NPDC056531]
MTGPARPRPRLPRPGLRTTLSLAFAAMAALVAVLIGTLGYRAAEHLIRDDETDDFTSAVRAVSGQVEREKLYPGDFNGPSGLSEQLLHPIRVTAQALDSTGAIVPGTSHLDLPTTSDDRELAHADAPARTVTDVRRLGGNTCRVG